jgi:hypothetical protein
VKNVLLNCDQVFEVLTRGPFPTGEASDEAVEHHLRACHDCRRLAEALRPAVSLLHEAIQSDHAMALPEYQGSLPDSKAHVQKPSKGTVRNLGVRQIARPSRAVRSRVDRPHHLVNAVRLTAAAILVAALGAMLYGVSMSARNSGAPNRVVNISPRTPQEGDKALPDAEGLLRLASLELPTICLPPSHRAASDEQAAMLALAMTDGTLEALRCCTECHRAGSSSNHNRQMVASVGQSCQVCHRG